LGCIVCIEPKRAALWLCFKSGILDGVLSGAFFEVVQLVELLFPTLLCLASQMSRVLEGFSSILKFDIEASKRGDSTRVQRLEKAYLSKLSSKIPKNFVQDYLGR
jgi:hypothetical protein